MVPGGFDGGCGGDGGSGVWYTKPIIIITLKSVELS